MLKFNSEPPGQDRKFFVINWFGGICVALCLTLLVAMKRESCIRNVLYALDFQTSVKFLLSAKPGEQCLLILWFESSAGLVR